ncbi:GNAT family N-acetyltransferase [Nodularia spumigena CS-586/05]|uniref:GNAT family N-acetyltransferase n=1 Tax=Nodularia spumigena TaxID=70799 RepID=UPI002330ADEC|nr:GNAT family N-acetyltransferase [Nodularia spumigena]MDB9342977.1 GNAT family N-acetyltransferase [Nodularia spumigena CS-588/06]MDB9350287.1 GNAT family N-acetyltransferase [Nodularia spumigena CS-588/01]MDB9352273.1 GNAT family N-acetyltransferase [Nodularia spumigena CS-588/05]MDB9369643.1 GNAT family N-acetyltransferase [Nodularia spumigena CS-586/05]
MNTDKFQYSTLTDKKDIQQLGFILEQCFVMSSGDSEIYMKRLGRDKLRAIYQDQQLVGGLATIPMGQWWGGQCVPMTGIAAVGIAPEYRGSGAAIALIEKTLQELYHQEVPISVLYPATQRLYRKAGYEQGGSYCTWKISTDNIQVKELSLLLQSVDPQNYLIFQDLYQQQAKFTHGYLNRHPAIWQGLTQPDAQETVYGYLIGDKDQPQGYIIFTQERTQNGTILKVRDWTMLTKAAVQSFWSFIANHRSQIDQVQWKSSLVDSLTLLLPEQTAKISDHKRWMLRIIDLVKALEMRGYPPGVSDQLHLEVKDDLLPANNGKFILSVADGRGEVTKGGKGELQLDITGLAPLYTSLFSPQQLQLTGKLQATQTALLAATQIFAASSPGMVDFF